MTDIPIYCQAACAPRTRRLIGYAPPHFTRREVLKSVGIVSPSVMELKLANSAELGRPHWFIAVCGDPPPALDSIGFVRAPGDSRFRRITE